MKEYSYKNLDLILFVFLLSESMNSSDVLSVVIKVQGLITIPLLKRSFDHEDHQGLTKFILYSISSFMI